MESIHCLPHRIWPGIGWRHAFQHCSNIFKLNKCAKCLTLGITSYYNQCSSLTMCEKAGLLLQHNCFICVFSYRIFSHWASERWYQYGSILLPCSTLLAILLCLASYKQCSTWLLKVLHKSCNMNMLGILLIYPHSPSGAACPRNRTYISVKPLTVMLQ